MLAGNRCICWNSLRQVNLQLIEAMYEPLEPGFAHERGADSIQDWGTDDLEFDKFRYSPPIALQVNFVARFENLIRWNAKLHNFLKHV
jgi:hypothetical protein